MCSTSSLHIYSHLNVGTAEPYMWLRRRSILNGGNSDAVIMKWNSHPHQIVHRGTGCQLFLKETLCFLLAFLNFVPHSPPYCPPWCCRASHQGHHPSSVSLLGQCEMNLSFKKSPGWILMTRFSEHLCLQQKMFFFLFLLRWWILERGLVICKKEEQTGCLSYWWLHFSDVFLLRLFPPPSY